jgi:hypothetical protein
MAFSECENEKGNQDKSMISYRNIIDGGLILVPETTN